MLQDCHKTDGFGWDYPSEVALWELILRMSLFFRDVLDRRLFMHRVSGTDMRRGSEWLTGLVRTMDAVTHDGVCNPGDAILNDRFAVYLRQSRPIARISIVPELGEALVPARERVRN